MEKVYLLIDSYANDGGYEDHRSGRTLLGVFPTFDTACRILKEYSVEKLLRDAPEVFEVYTLDYDEIFDNSTREIHLIPKNERDYDLYLLYKWIHQIIIEEVPFNKFMHLDLDLL